MRINSFLFEFPWNHKKESFPFSFSLAHFLYIYEYPNILTFSHKSPPLIPVCMHTQVVDIFAHIRVAYMNVCLPTKKIVTNRSTKISHRCHHQQASNKLHRKYRKWKANRCNFHFFRFVSTFDSSLFSILSLCLW